MYHFRLERDDDAFVTSLNIHCIPVRAGRARLMLQSPTFKVPDFLTHILSNSFLNSDIWLHEAEIAARSRSTKSSPYVYASRSDTGVKLFRQWWSTYGMSGSPKNTFGAADPKDLMPLSREQQVDPWEFHSRQCAICRKTIRMARRVQFGGLFAAILSASFLRRAPIPAILLMGVGLSARLMAGKLIGVTEGNPQLNEIPFRSIPTREDYVKIKKAKASKS